MHSYRYRQLHVQLRHSQQIELLYHNLYIIGLHYIIYYRFWAKKYDRLLLTPQPACFSVPPFEISSSTHSEVETYTRDLPAPQKLREKLV